MSVFLVRPAHGFKPYEKINLEVSPCPTILASGDPGAFAYWLEDDGYPFRMINTEKCLSRVLFNKPAPTVQTHGRLKTYNELSLPVGPVQDTGMIDSNSHKPPYRVPLMSEIVELPRNGLTVVSTFAGGGGSSVGYWMAGYQVLWANEFERAAQDTYQRNFPTTILDRRDIRQIEPDAILVAIQKSLGEIDLFDGSPPCRSFSTAGLRDKGWKKAKVYERGVQWHEEDLFFEYARLLKGLQPKVFVAENVSGLVKGVAKGYFKEILAALKACGYVVEARLLDAQWLGVPQMRQRIIFVGVRQDLVETYGVHPIFPKPLPYRYSVRDALPWIHRQGDNGGFGEGAMQDAQYPSPTIGTGTQAGNGRFPPSLVEVRAYLDKRGAFWHDGDCTDMPAPTVLSDSVGTHWIEPETDTQSGGNHSTASVTHPMERRKFTIAELKRICAFPDDFHLTGSYAQQWARLGNAVPPLMMRAIAETIRDQILHYCRHS